MNLKRYLKLTVYFFLYYSGFIFFLIIAGKQFKKEHPAIILFYHRFSQTKSKQIPPKLYNQIFKKQLWHLKRWYNIISLDELVEGLKNEQQHKKPSIVITIDDGFYDNYRIAYPLLKKYHLPTTIYLTTGFIGTQRAPWIDEIAHALNNCSEKEIQFEKLFNGKTFNISTYRNKYELWESIYDQLLYLEQNTKNDLVNQILNRLNSERIPKKRLMLNWFEVKEMSKNHISFGAHTVTHPTLSKMAVEEAKQEIRESKKVIEKEIGAKVRHFAIPNGKVKDFNEELREFCKREGFVSVVTTNIGCVDKDSDLYALPRFYPNDQLFVFAIELARLFIFGR